MIVVKTTATNMISLNLITRNKKSGKSLNLKNHSSDN
jgi:hypothetical protein